MSPLRRAIALLPVLASLAGSALAQTPFPARPLTIVVNGGAGSLPDLFARPLADRLRQALGQPVVVDNRPGAGGMVAMQVLKSAPADGHTLALVTNAHAVWNPYVFPKLGYDPAADLLPVSPVAVIPMALAVHAKLPATTLEELVALAKAKPGQLNYASSSNGSPPHVLFELFKSQSGTDIVHVPFKTGPDALTSVAAGDTQVYLAATSLLEPLVKDGRLRVLAVSPAVDNPTFRGVPTLASRGHPGFESAVWLGVVARTGVPAEVVARLNREIGAALQDPALQQAIAGHGSIAWHDSAEAFAQRIAADRARWNPLLQKLNIQAN
ncbi:Bug family tripartite tricarboxylate transporter substrate binding protein [Pseudorhodoferax sp.]|uniref:Bug family tripartite tricarboxylate transporter substrate binding protein n=1 Tax=Pseudorhodoferax sp. TaxID=1993553 RepID=UPI002DD6257A|nr:tripartite tricarboxylate transporter substrate-binding protein [Pseudorhodoferax sp.]